MADALTDRELQGLRNEGNAAERAADEIVELRAEVERLRAAPAPVAQPLTAAQMGKCVLESGRSWGTLSRLPDNLHKLTRAVERACAEAWGVKLGDA